jgi:ribonuclease BN (tRNA processing enzyme)
VRITILGKSPSWQDAGGACSGYLVEHADHALLIDCGNGVFGKLRPVRDYMSLDAVVVSHLHADHFIDLVPFSYALRYAPRAGDARPVLHAPTGSTECFRRVVGAWGGEDLIEGAFDLREYAPGDSMEVGPLRLETREVVHFVSTCAIAVTAGDAPGRFVFGADTAPTEALVEHARDADLLIVESTLTEPEPDDDRGHLTPAEAGDHARRAGVGRLVLTHISDEIDQSWALREATEAFGGPVEIAHEGAVYVV